MDQGVTMEPVYVVALLAVLAGLPLLLLAIGLFKLKFLRLAPGTNPKTGLPANSSRKESIP
jgi:hypothetical protein